MNIDDMELVRQYAHHQSESAFATLVSRHANLVYSASLRIVGETHLAEEVAQAVFLILAQKAASLDEKTILPSWLYRAACFTALNARNKEQRRQQREQEAYMQALPDENPTEAAWEHISPLLEEAMLELAKTDRDALVLRFFEGRTLTEVGSALGASEDAAKKRVTRALEKLRKIFTKRGVVLTSTLIAGAISANSVHAAPGLLANTITAVAVAKGAAATTSSLTLAKGGLKLMAWAKAKTAVVVGLGLILAAGSIAVSFPVFKKHPIDPESNVPVTLTVRMKDGSKTPSNIQGTIFALWRQGGWVSENPLLSQNGVLKSDVPRTQASFAAWSDTLAPTLTSVIDLRDKTSLKLDVVLEPGFDVFVKVLDEETGQPISGAAVRISLENNWGTPTHTVCIRGTRTGTDGVGTIKHCAALKANVRIKLPEYEETAKEVSLLEANQEIELRIKKAMFTGGIVTDKGIGLPITAAEIYPGSAAWERGNYTRLSKTDTKGRFNLDQLSRETAHDFYVCAAGYGGTMLTNVQAGQTNLAVQLGPELSVVGYIAGDLQTVTNLGDSLQVWTSFGENGMRYGKSISLRHVGPFANFSFTNPFPGQIGIQVGRETFTLSVTNGINGWEINLTNGITAKPTRSVVLHFDSVSGASAEGTAFVTIADPLSSGAKEHEFAIDGGEISVQEVIDSTMWFKPGNMKGGWFRNDQTIIPPGKDAFVVHVPLYPAGSISGQFQNADGTPARDVKLTYVEEERSRWLTNNWAWLPEETYLPESKFQVSPLIVDGSYCLVGIRGFEVCSSDPIALTQTESNPHVTMQFSAKQEVSGNIVGPDKKPVKRAQIYVEWDIIRKAGFTSRTLGEIKADEQGAFHFQGTEPGAGYYNLLVISPGMRVKNIKVEQGTLPLTIYLERGLRLFGRIVDEKTGEPLRSVRVVIYGAESITDDNGNFEFDTLDTDRYGVFLEPKSMIGRRQIGEFNASEEPVVIKVPSTP